MNCYKCGFKNPKGSKFCSKCGCKLISQESKVIQEVVIDSSNASFLDKYTEKKPQEKKFSALLITVCIIFIVFILSPCACCSIYGGSHSDNDKGCIEPTINKTKRKVIDTLSEDINQIEPVGYCKRGNVRFFSVYTPHLNWDAMKKYGKQQMHTEGHPTTVYFFNNRNNTPDITYVCENFDNKYEKYWIAGYWKYPTGIEKFLKYPGKK